MKMTSVYLFIIALLKAWWPLLHCCGVSAWVLGKKGSSSRYLLLQLSKALFLCVVLVEMKKPQEIFAKHCNVSLRQAVFQNFSNILWLWVIPWEWSGCHKANFVSRNCVFQEPPFRDWPTVPIVHFYQVVVHNDRMDYLAVRVSQEIIAFHISLGSCFRSLALNHAGSAVSSFVTFKWSH